MSTKVILLIGTLNGGGAERAVSTISINLPKIIEKEIILFGENAKIEYGYKGSITYLDKATLSTSLSKVKVLIKRIVKLKKIKKQNHNTPMISFLEYPNLLNILSGTNRNSVVSVRNFMSTKHQKGIKAFCWNLSIKYFYKQAKKIVVVSKQMKDDLIENYNLPAEKIQVIYNSYPINEINNLTKESLKNDEQTIFNKPTVITAGRLSNQKGQHHLLRAFKKVKENIPNAQLVFLGEGSLESHLREKANEMELANSVHFFGFKHNPFKYIAQSKVFVMTSYYEGFPNALAEAMACKVPVISTDCASGPREILAPNEKGQIIDYENHENRYGFLVQDFNNEDANNVEGTIAKLVQELINNNEKWATYSDKSYERIKDFDIDTIINEWSDLITN